MNRYPPFVLHTRRLAALSSLFLAALYALGIEARHSPAHLLAPGFGAEHFEAGHAEPISYEHVEAAHRAVDEACVACVLLHPSSGPARLSQAGPNATFKTLERPIEPDRGFDQLAFSPLRGRAPPAA